MLSVCAMARENVDTCTVTTDGFIYSCAGTPCNGYISDYYDSEGSCVRLTGRFKNGVPVDTVKEYYRSGALKSIYYRYNKQYLYAGAKYNYCMLIEYNEQGRCTRYSDDKAGADRCFGDNGELLSVLSYARRKNKSKYYVTYIPGTKSKTIVSGNKRYEYDHEGRLRCYWVRMSERADRRSGVKCATYYVTNYDVNGGISTFSRLYTNIRERDDVLHIEHDFPESFETVPPQDFKEISYPLIDVKDVYKWDYENNRTIITRYVFEDNLWVETEKRSLPRITRIN